MKQEVCFKKQFFKSAKHLNPFDIDNEETKSLYCHIYSVFFFKFNISAVKFVVQLPVCMCVCARAHIITASIFLGDLSQII